MFKENNPEYKAIAMTYAGRLDPMAEGLLLVLSGDKVYEKEIYTNLPKRYECEILWGFKTDTQDILGLASDATDIPVPSIEEVRKVLQSFIKRYDQKYPAYSSQTVGGKSLIEWSREGKIQEVEIPVHSVEMTSVDSVSRRSLRGDELGDEIQRRIGLVAGDFRQGAISTRWHNLLNPKKEKIFIIDSCTIDVSGGFYVRQLITDVAEKLGTQAVTFHIKRTKIGSF